MFGSGAGELCAAVGCLLDESAVACRVDYATGMVSGRTGWQGLVERHWAGVSEAMTWSRVWCGSTA